MELSELAAYAKRKYQIEAQHKWADFPGFSVLCHPQSGKWVALLMRQWDSKTGREIAHCDVKCGPQVLSDNHKPYLSRPVRMRSQKWVNIAFTQETDPDVVFRLFDLAMTLEQPEGYTIILDDTPIESKQEHYRETLLPFSGAGTKEFSHKKHETYVSDIPEQIRRMLGLYEYGNATNSHKVKMFYKQGKFMEHYEDDALWQGDFHRYFATYHDLNIRQLRGYFGWRTRVRQGHYTPVPLSLAYLYIYELLCGIGATSPEDVLDKVTTFEKGYVDAGMADPDMKRNIRRWMFEYAVIHTLPLETACLYADPEVMAKDHALTVLKTPEAHSDEDVFEALCLFTTKKLQDTPVVTKEGSKGFNLFADVWHHLITHCQVNDKPVFSACFGNRSSRVWHPLANAVYWDEREPKDIDYILNESRSYHLKDGTWYEESYDLLHFDKSLLNAIMHETDRMLRKHLKTGRYLRAKQEEAWLTPYIEAVLAAKRQRDIDAARPKIVLDFSGLARIRAEALSTRDSLLTEEEKAAYDESLPEETPKEERYEEIVPEYDGLDSLHLKIVTLLLQEQSIDYIIKTNYLMPSIVTDTINEVLFDEIGDNVLVCDGNDISIIEDYKEDLIQLLGGEN